jgi:hypothetical protein
MTASRLFRARVQHALQRISRVLVHRKASVPGWQRLLGHLATGMDDEVEGEGRDERPAQRAFDHDRFSNDHPSTRCALALVTLTRELRV